MSLASRLFLALSMAPVLFAQTQFATDVLAMNPLGYWTLNPSNGFNDSSPNGHNGSAPNGAVPFLSPGPPLGTPATSCCQTASFDRGTFVSIPGATFNLGALHALTALAWTKTVDQRDASLIVGKVDPVANTGWALGIDNGDLVAPVGSGRLMLIFVVAGNPVLLVESTASVNDGSEHLVAATYDGSGKASGVLLYIDGVAVATTTLADAVGSSSILNTEPLTIGAAPDGSSSFEGDVSQVAVFGVALTAAQNLQLAEDAGEFQRILSQFAFGGGWYSAVYFTNTGAGSVSFPVKFTDDSGNPLNIISIGGSSTTITLAAGGSAVIEAPNAGSLVQGYVTAALPIGVSGYGVFRQSVAGIPDQEAVAPLGIATGQFYSLLYDETNFVTAVAIVNPSTIGITVAITVVDINGKTIGTGSVMLPPLSKTEAVLKSVPGLSAMVGNRGTAQFSVAAGALTVLGLRFNGAAFTSISAFAKAGI